MGIDGVCAVDKNANTVFDNWKPFSSAHAWILFKQRWSYNVQSAVYFEFTRAITFKKIHQRMYRTLGWGTERYRPRPTVYFTIKREIDRILPYWTPISWEYASDRQEVKNRLALETDDLVQTSIWAGEAVPAWLASGPKNSSKYNSIVLTRVLQWRGHAWCLGPHASCRPQPEQLVLEDTKRGF